MSARKEAIVRIEAAQNQYLTRRFGLNQRKLRRIEEASRKVDPVSKKTEKALAKAESLQADIANFFSMLTDTEKLRVSRYMATDDGRPRSQEQLFKEAKSLIFRDLPGE